MRIGNISIFAGLEDLYRPSSAAHIIEVKAEQAGYITELPAMEFGLFAMRLGAGRAVKSDDLDYETGIVLRKEKSEDKVEIGEVFAKI